MNSQGILEDRCMPELRYAVVLEPSPIAEGGGYSVTVPAFRRSLPKEPRLMRRSKWRATPSPSRYRPAATWV